MSGVQGGSVAINHKAEILERMARGEPISGIAEQLGYAGHQGIVERLGKDPDYQEALRCGIIGKIEKRETELESAGDNVAVTRADRLLGHARWWAERLDPARFGQRPLVQVNMALGVDDSTMGKLSDLLNRQLAAPQQTTDLEQVQSDTDATSYK